MKRSYYIGIIILALIGGLISFILRPQENEIAYMNLQDKRFEEALGLYKKKYDNGDKSLSVMIPLSRLYLQYGNVDKAAEIMEEYVKLNPESMEARKELGILYQFSQRPEDYLKNIEIIATLEPTAEILRELANIYNFNEQYDKQIVTLRRIITQFEPTEQDILNLSYLYASRDEYDKALRVFDEIPQEMIATLSPYTAHYILSLMLDTGAKERAAGFIDRYFYKHKDYEELASAIAMMHNKGALKEALGLLEPMMDEVKQNPRLLEEFSYIQIASGNTDQSYTILLRWFKTGSLPNNLFDPFIDMAMQRNDINTLKDVMNLADITALSVRRLLGIAEYALTYDHRDLASLAMQSLGSGFLAKNPILSTAFLIASGKWDEGNIITASLQQTSNSNKMVLINMLEKAKQHDAALTVLKQLENTLMQDSVNFMNLAWFYAKFDQIDRGITLFKKIEKHIDPSQKIYVENGLRVLAAATGDNETLLPWISQQTLEQYSILENVYFISQEKKQGDIALASARKLNEFKPSKETTLYLANALLLHNDYKQALAYLRDLKKAYPESIPSYVKALALISKEQPELKKEMAQFLQSTLFKKLPAELVRDTAFELLELKKKPAAESIFFALAKDGVANSADVDQLLYLWGPFPPEYGEKWLLSRTEKAKGEEQTLWLQHVNSITAYEDTIRIVEKHGVGRSIERQNVYLEALIETLAFDKLATIIPDLAQQTKDRKRLMTLAQYASDSNQMELATHLYERLHELYPQNAIIIKKLAMLSYNRGDYPSAKQYFTDYIAYNENDYEAYYYYGEILNTEKKHDDAAQRYNKVRELIVASPSKDINMEFTGAMAEYRLGHVNEAFATMRKLIKETPKDAGMRERFANLLIEVGMYSEAEDILSENGL